MTTQTPRHNRQAATPQASCDTAQSRSGRATQRLLLTAALAVCALPAFAQSASQTGTAAGSAIGGILPGGPSLRNDSADAPEPTAGNMLPEAMTLSDRALMLATDLNRLLGQGQDVALSKTDMPVAEQGRIKGMLQRALALLGTPYRWGGTSPDQGFDCSGLVGYVFRNALGIELPRVSREMAKTGEVIDRDAMTEGDLVFFGRRGRVDHVGIYLGDGRFVHAPRTGKDVTVSSLDSGYWSGKFMEARRVDGI
ncbi:C40 family peptidase [Pseudomonas sp. CGJS7]|uniref:C40 family peptidase n=1 Tax=Pseudomonas sp. CGJS7 TaxID=3109348 RepID=UPI003009D1FC